MATQLPTDAEAFYAFLGQEIQNGGRETAPEEILSHWRRKYAQAMEDLEQGRRDWEAGRYHTLEEVDTYIRRRFNLPPREE